MIKMNVVDLDEIANQGRCAWCGPSLAAFISEVETCRTHTEYFSAVIERGKQNIEARFKLIEHCDARACVWLNESMALVVAEVESAMESANIPLLIATLTDLRKLVIQYFRLYPCSHRELQFHFVFQQLMSTPWSDGHFIRACVQPFLRYLVGRTIRI